MQMDAVIDLVAGRATKLVLEFRRADRGWMHGARVGFKRVPPEDLLERAVEAARAADVALVVVGTNNDWESEGHDRTSLDLPGNQAELIARVCEANPRTIVVTNTGAPVTMAWADGVPAILQIWFGGQEMADALVDVLLGDSEPSGRLAVTYPEHIEHTPAFGNFPGEHGQVRYGEGVLVGYRWYEARLLPTRYPFGHGLGYTSFVIDTVRTPDAFDAGDESATLTVDVDVTNTGLRAGSEVVQCYVGAPAGQVVRPPKELKAFAKVHLEPGETTTVRLVLDRRSFAYWRPEPDVPTTTWVQPPTASMTVPAALPPGWTVEPGWYTLFIGRSSADIALVIGLNVTA